MLKSNCCVRRISSRDGDDHMIFLIHRFWTTFDTFQERNLPSTVRFTATALLISLSIFKRDMINNKKIFDLMNLWRPGVPILFHRAMFTILALYKSVTTRTRSCTMDTSQEGFLPGGAKFETMSS